MLGLQRVGPVFGCADPDGLFDVGNKDFAVADLAGLGGIHDGLGDLIQTRHTLWRNFPLLGRLRGVAETLRSYVLEDNDGGAAMRYFLMRDGESGGWAPFPANQRITISRDAG